MDNAYSLTPFKCAGFRRASIYSAAVSGRLMACIKNPEALRSKQHSHTDKTHKALSHKKINYIQNTRLWLKQKRTQVQLATKQRQKRKQGLKGKSEIHSAFRNVQVKSFAVRHNCSNTAKLWLHLKLKLLKNTFLQACRCRHERRWQVSESCYRSVHTRDFSQKIPLTSAATQIWEGSQNPHLQCRQWAWMRSCCCCLWPECSH